MMYFIVAELVGIITPARPGPVA